MKTGLRFSTEVLPVIVCAATMAPLASAGCGDIASLQPPFQLAQTQATTVAASHDAPASRSGYPLFYTATPVGMWNIQFISQGNTAHNPSIQDGALIDFGYVQWHSDGTEIMNSGIHAPATQNFCLGVWVRTGVFNYEINHFALSYNASTGALAGKVNIREQITLDPSGFAYAGTFTIDAYDPTSGQKVDHVAGNISATRVTVDQTQP